MLAVRRFNDGLVKVLIFARDLTKSRAGCRYIVDVGQKRINPQAKLPGWRGASPINAGFERYRIRQ